MPHERVAKSLQLNFCRRCFYAENDHIEFSIYKFVIEGVMFISR
jgi:hypothetical protein